MKDQYKVVIMFFFSVIIDKILLLYIAGNIYIFNLLSYPVPI